MRAGLVWWLVLCGALARGEESKPNFILIFTDDQGYQDLGCFGSPSIRTPNLDRMAAEGLRLTGFYAQPVCGVSRGALLTGCYPIRIGEPGNVKHLHTELHPEEITMAEVLRDAGYATGIIGKWHAGDVMPNDQGFDSFYGTPKYNGATVRVADSKFRSPILRNREVVVEAVENWDHITGDYTREAITWIEAQRDQPFFLYLAHNLPHIPLGASERFKGKSAYGPYGDALEEIDWSCGEIFAALKRLGLDENTLVVFTSDNGPWIETTQAMDPKGAPFIPRNHSGSAEPLRGWKMSAWDGGCRVPFLARWPGKIPAGAVSGEILSTMDLLPTFASLGGATLPDRTLDGLDASDFLLGNTATSPRDEYFYYTGCLLTGVRSGPWKLVLPRPAHPAGTGWWGRMIEAVAELQLFDVVNDPGESVNVAGAHPDIVAGLMKRIDRAREELGDLDRTGSGARFFEAGPRRLQAEGGKPKVVAPAPREFAPLGAIRFTFESGDLEGWKIVEGNPGQPVSSHASLPRWKTRPFHQEGRYYLSTIATADGFSDRQTAVLESPAFTLRGGRAAFLVSGGEARDTLNVALIDRETGEELRRAGGSNGPAMARLIWDVSPWQGKTVFLRVTDRDTGGWGHLTFDDFSAEGELVVP